MNNFCKTLTTNILIVLGLVPMVLILNSLIAWNDSPFLWIIIGILSLAGISYLQSKDAKPHKTITKDSYSSAIEKCHWCGLEGIGFKRVGLGSCICFKCDEAFQEEIRKGGVLP